MAIPNPIPKSAVGLNSKPVNRAVSDAVATTANLPAADSTKKPLRVIVGISGASGVSYGIRLLELLQQLQIETHLVMTKAAELTLAYETSLTPKMVRELASFNHPIGNVAAPISSGTFKTLGMIVAPCSIKSLSEIATGTTQSLLTRAADVCLKERRRLVLMVRETPLHLGHLRSMVAVSEIGGIIMPPVPAFYAAPAKIEDLVTHSALRAIELLGIDTAMQTEWTG